MAPEKLPTENEQRCSPAELLLKVILAGTLSHYETRGMIDDKQLEQMLAAEKKIVSKTRNEMDVRQSLALSPDVWQGLTDVLTKAIPHLESQSFAWKSPPTSTYEQSSSNLIAYNYFSLVKDIERLRDLCTIARNLLATTNRAQNLAAEKGFDQRILALIDTCVRVTARGFDGESNARNEERWQKVVNLYKSLLIICLQFLNNFIMQNEQRKLVLWLDLFGYHSNGDHKVIMPGEPLDPASPAPQGVAPIVRTGERLIGSLRCEQTAEDMLLESLSTSPKEPLTVKEEAAMLLLAQIKDHMEKILGRDMKEIQEMGKDPEQVNQVRSALTEILSNKADEMKSLKGRTLDSGESDDETRRQPILCIDRSATTGYPRVCWADFPDFERFKAITADGPLSEEETSVPRIWQSGAAALTVAKEELMARAQEASQALEEGDEHYDHDDGYAEDDGHSLDDGAEGSLDEEEEEDDDDDDYRGRPGDQQRGLLTDIPLVLGPAEIEALPMIIKAGIIDAAGTKSAEREVISNMQAIRCHILLTQDTGRNLLRELLIFIAAWDLPDDEVYFQFMVQIMEAILKNGLMSHAYADFGQQKDIISPAQAVVIKILTHIFRNKYSPASSSDGQSTETKQPPPLSRVDVLTVRYIFSIFRGTIIPETCGLIYLQGQIRANKALPEDFPLNLWDMERVYEGVYQFLEFFAVLTENNDWKNLIVKWEIVYDLVTLISELDANIPKGPLSAMVTNPAGSSNGRTAAANNQPDTPGSQQQNPPPVAVERPYDPTDVDPVDENIDETGSRAESPPITEDPCEFEWRNLKKLIVLVLSSLVWRCPEVQNQIRKFGGVEAILSCTSFDAHNPYMKEHAVMCLKFLLENNKENQKIVEELEAREVVRDDSGVLAKTGHEAVVDGVGKLTIQKVVPSSSTSNVVEEVLDE
ncbi:essential cytoplasmic protein Ctr86, putative [Talaromyces stipitatus ATCC 10500]|uniref:Ataxin-10 homolog n=1 Tax=Talaromyces stipitatus (strain ATCC 10500 / CBS 375.48 / QM 6759 / NRRL 1006) TaxID=441959 RepID=B8LTK5_TALSN|nr:essential cytoplasmic protein Ctr86, putative [Talaromyces stipitatus ATCC 10500]EED23083.1 essential cytoplasmic protein Ctr86, putative [Talaromyces stipitatus ATCC 10500]